METSDDSYSLPPSLGTANAGRGTVAAESGGGERLWRLEWSKAEVEELENHQSPPLFNEIREPNRRGVTRGAGAHHDRGVGAKNGAMIWLPK
jgi:hypothetical protein